MAASTGEPRFDTMNAAASFEIGLPSRKRVVSVKLEETLLAELDRVWRELGYRNRSEFLREAIIWYMMVARIARQRGLCVCECGAPGTKSIQDWLYEQIAGDTPDL